MINKMKKMENAALIPAEIFSRDEGEDYVDFVFKEISKNLAQKIMDIPGNKEVILKISDRQYGIMEDLYSVECKRNIEWKELIRCKACNNYANGWCVLNKRFVNDDYYCADAQEKAL